MNVGVVGSGYVGLVTGVCLAERGNKVFCVDNNPEVVEKLSSGEITIYEPGLEDIFLRNLKKERIEFSGKLESAGLRYQVVFLCLPPPPGVPRGGVGGRGSRAPRACGERPREGPGDPPPPGPVGAVPPRRQPRHR